MDESDEKKAVNQAESILKEAKYGDSYSRPVIEGSSEHLKQEGRVIVQRITKILAEKMKSSNGQFNFSPQPPRPDHKWITLGIAYSADEAHENIMPTELPEGMEFPEYTLTLDIIYPLDKEAIASMLHIRTKLGVLPQFFIDKKNYLYEFRERFVFDKDGNAKRKCFIYTAGPITERGMIDEAEDINEIIDMLPKLELDIENPRLYDEGFSDLKPGDYEKIGFFLNAIERGEFDSPKQNSSDDLQ